MLYCLNSDILYTYIKFGTFSWYSISASLHNLNWNKSFEILTTCYSHLFFSDLYKFNWRNKKRKIDSTWIHLICVLNESAHTYSLLWHQVYAVFRHTLSVISNSRQSQITTSSTLDIWLGLCLNITVAPAIQDHLKAKYIKRYNWHVHFLHKQIKNTHSTTQPVLDKWWETLY